MTAQEFAELIQAAVKPEEGNTEPQKPKRLEYGIAGIARIFDCSIATANRIKASGKIAQAISQLNRKIVIDVDLALELMRAG